MLNPALRLGGPLLVLLGLSASACVSSSPVDPGEGDGGSGGTGPAAGPGSTTGGGEGGSSTTPAVAGSGGSTGEGGAGAGAGGGGGASPDPCPRVRVDVPGGEVLNVRPTPSTDGAPVGTLPDGSLADVLDQVEGESVDGNTLWFHVEKGSLEGFVSAVFAACTTDEPPAPPEGYLLPLECEMTVTVTQGNDGDTSHTGGSRYAFDFGIPRDTPVVAMADGEVVLTYDETGPGDPCYDGGGSDCNPYTNFVSLRHGDGTATVYKHLNAVAVTAGQVVSRAEVIGHSGTTGWSTGPHLHVARTEDCGQSYCVSIPLSFADVPGDGVPVTGQSVTSGNCVD